MDEFEGQSAMVKQILDNCGDYEWSIQGFGMLRTNISEYLRLHIWDSRCRVDDVSDIHTHPWNFSSTVIAGWLTNNVYLEAPTDESLAPANGLALYKALLIPGEKAHLIEEPQIGWYWHSSMMTY